VRRTWARSTALVAVAVAVAGSLVGGGVDARAQPTTVATAALLVDHLRGVHDARQVVSVIASGYGSSYATVRAFGKTSSGWRRIFGPWPARTGRNGFAPRGDKREGDGRTPTGSFHLQFMFGVDANPGVHFRYRRSLATSKWDDDSASANYNLWVDTRYGYPGRNPESMRVLPVYRYGVVVGYNTARTPGRGSAIFFHVTDGQATAGCIAVGRARVLRLLRWLRPARKPRMIMGTKAAVTN
jgi:L,D-peptidoglycan transpeptidase YkuD (ErfK/YbiS/YcfS/YnhG family)